MYPDDDSQTTLSKWPFILGDVLLVATALAIGILGNWQLTNWQVASCVVSVALGACLFILPYIVEFQVRVKEEQEGSLADLHILQKQVQGLSSSLESMDQRMRDISAEMKQDASIEALGQQIDDLQELQKAQEAEIKRLSVVEASKEIDQSSDIEALNAKLLAIEETQKEWSARQSTRIEEVKPEDANSPESENRPESLKAKRSTKERPARQQRERRMPEPRLLKRAIEVKQDKSSSAVNRIIGSTSVPEAEVSLKEEESISSAAVEPTTGAAKSKAVQRIVEETAPKPATVKSSELEPLPVVAEKTEDMFAETVPDDASKSIKVKAKRSDTVIVASVFIGIGNKPYLRGGGAGLSWEVGLPMEFEEIGKWRWIAPDGFDSEIEIQVYRNDEDVDKHGKYTLEPGQRLEISPLF